MKRNEQTGTVKVNFNFPIKGLDGKPLSYNDEPVIAGKMLGTMFSSLTKGDAFKLMEWARKCYHGHDIELNAGELKLVEDIIIGCDGLSALSKEQILIALNK